MNENVERKKSWNWRRGEAKEKSQARCNAKLNWRVLTLMIGSKPKK